VRILWVSRCFMMLDCIICSKILQRIQVSETGR
jgi:hypothetical protein